MSTVNSSTSTSYITSSYTSGLTDLDTAQLVEDAYNIKMEAADVIEVEIDDIELQIAAYNDLLDLLETLSDASEALTSEAELDISRDDVWVGKSAYLTSSDANTDAADIVGVMVEDTTATGSYTIEVIQTATAHKIGGETTTDKDSAAGLDGTLSLVAGDDYSAVDIEITSDMSLDDIAEAINDQSSATGVKATILKVSDDEYMLVLSATATGENITFDSDGADTAVAQALGFVDESGAYANELVEAEPAILNIDGVEITRKSNTVDDVIDGVTLYLYAEEEGTQITLDIEQDASSAYSAIEAFVDAYNELRSFMLTHQAYTAGEGADEDAVLFGDSLLSSLTRDVYSALRFSEDSNTYQSLAAIGITLDSSNYLVIDSTVLEEAMVSDFDSVAALFSMESDTGSDDLLIFDTDGSYAGNFTVNVTVDADGTLSSADVGGDSSLFTIDGNKIVGASGTAYEGLTLFYGGDTSQSIDVTISSGLAFKMMNSLESYTNTSDGFIQARIDRLEEQTSSLNEDVTEITEKADAYAADLVERYAAIETKLYQLELLRTQLEALWGNNDD
ncbi:MAG: flagellar filament capping protein FliD [Pseudomonadota bacterium]